MINGVGGLFRESDDKATRLRLAVMTALGTGAWWTAHDLCVAIEGLDKRTIRLISERARGAIISSDRLGYKLNDHATKEERAHCENVFLTLARKYQQKAVDVRQYPMKRAARRA